MAALPGYSARTARSRAAPPKLVALSNAFLAVTDPRGSPNPATEPERFGAWVENACLAYARNEERRVSYWREESLEVDVVIEESRGSRAIEVRTGAVSNADIQGLGEFTRRHPRFTARLVCGEQGKAVAQRSGTRAAHWREFLLSGASEQQGSRYCAWAKGSLFTLPPFPFSTPAPPSKCSASRHLEVGTNSCKPGRSERTHTRQAERSPTRWE